MSKTASNERIKDATRHVMAPVYAAQDASLERMISQSTENSASRRATPAGAKTPSQIRAERASEREDRRRRTIKGIKVGVLTVAATAAGVAGTLFIKGATKPSTSESPASTIAADLTKAQQGEAPLAYLKETIIQTSNTVSGQPEYTVKSIPSFLIDGAVYTLTPKAETPVVDFAKDSVGDIMDSVNITRIVNPASSIPVSSIGHAVLGSEGQFVQTTNPSEVVHLDQTTPLEA